jgi:Cu(I)/Ag(I) efflux system membrane fusion protein
MKPRLRSGRLWLAVLILPLLVAALSAAWLHRDRIPHWPQLAQAVGLEIRVPPADAAPMEAAQVDAAQVDAAQVDAAQVDAAQGGEAPGTERKILYYRNPMGLPDISPTPKKDSMGMDYIPVYESEAAGDNRVVEISRAKVQKLGVMSEAAVPRKLTRPVMATGVVAIDESRQVIVTSRFEGWIETLTAARTGERVKRGDLLLEIFSPSLRVAETQYLTTLKASPELAEIAKDQLRNKGMTDAQIAALAGQSTSTPPRTMAIVAPAAGQIVEKQAVLGMRVEAGAPLYRLVDLDRVWVIADIHEQELGDIRPGLPAEIVVDAYPAERFAGTVDLVYPMIAMDTRTAQIRIELDNQRGLLQPGMFANVSIAADMSPGDILAIPESAVLDDGREQTVLVDLGEGRFEPRAVKLSNRADGYVGVIDGLSAGEKVVVSASFLIDAESNLQAALRAFVSQQPATTEAGQ